jgi:di/tricarboxylate transporter
MAGGLLAMADGHPVLLLALVYVVTSALTNVMTNNAAAVLMYPLASAAADAAGLACCPSPWPS